MIFEGLAGCVRERQMINNNIKDESQINPKINEKSYTKLSRKVMRRMGGTGEGG